MALIFSAACALPLVAALACLRWLPGPIGATLAVVLLVLALVALAPAAGAWIAIGRQRRLQHGQADLFLQHNEPRSELTVSEGRTPRWSAVRRRLARRVFGHRHLVGDRVRIKPLETIRATLDAQGKLDGLPFMDEMAAFCGREAVVYRVVDKIYDYGRSRLMRPIDDCVLLVWQRCDGSAHGGCQAACYLIWKSQWLESQPGAAPSSPAVPVPAASMAAAGDAPVRYSCQYTELSSASRAAGRFEWRGVIGPWVVGNVTAGAFVVAVLTRVFNAVQARRGGLAYPWQPAAGNDKSLTGTPLRAGDWVRVAPSAEIARSLDKNSKNKGLWFDRDMLKHCGSTHRVRGRIDRIIDVNSGALIAMKTACIVLDGVHYSGEFQGFGEQHDFLYWREAWLDPVASPEQS